ncbi:hypothetical protein [Sulfurovum sp.]|uniref:hypothetical protein n=1 Tax=Sulfurovum sp. TaxID=1969726 RepID=UPI002A35966A|nr:hypothetical protein [Sulfurovum sp.]MDD2451506.1 hypothetical protein [Sulfurovum sp.]MDD3499533.1 hypothetical protein [Sulfurovum sp.]MDY0403087.1 hypothetical protein [Sulfurovum sp.]
MQAKVIELLLILSLSFNIAHDAFIAINEQSVCETISKYVMEQAEDSECGNIGEFHYLFHFTAILSPVHLISPSAFKTEPIRFDRTVQTILLEDKQVKPPIA